ncbi:MAG: ATP-binding protein [Chlorobi bacterium]|nr:ATP-binding protein [Ignavibacteriota bacterium]MBL1162165.1 ATP-binding protein [Chlorobiota bacterium]NOG68627.1 ATP-binding protein [Chlorobiota bacterium]
MYISLNEIKTLTLDTVKRLVDSKIPEGKLIDYKESLSVFTSDEKKEFLADVSSFANAEGGNLIYGVKEVDGIPTDICGFKVDSIDAEILKLENLIRDCTDPRVQGTLINYITLDNGQFVLVIYIPKSFNPPHVVKIGNHWKFYSRNSKGKYQLDVSELKSIISLSSNVQERIRDFRLERISRIKNRDLQIPISDEPKFIYHIVPLVSSTSNTVVDLAKFERANFKYELFYNLPKIYNYEGILIHNHQEGYNADLYVQIFRSGAIEVYASYLHNRDKQLVPRNSFEKELIEQIPNYISVIKYFELTMPLVIFLTVLDIKGYKIGLYEYENMREMYNRPFTLNDLLLPEVYIDDAALTNLPLALKPLFDPIWNAAGHPQSPNFNTSGEWTVKG